MAAPLLPFDEHDREQLLDLSVQQRNKLLAGIRALTGVTSHDAEDLLQDLWVQFLERGVSTEPESWFALLRTAAKNLHIDHVRRAARAEQAASRVPVPAWLARDRDTVTESIAFRTLFLDALTDLGMLPAKERQAFVLRHYDDLRPAAIAERMGLLTTQVDELLRQAKERLAKAQECRKGSRAYALLALILRPASDRADALSSPLAGVVTIAASVAVSLVTVISGGAPAPAEAATRPVQSPAAASPSSRGGAHLGPGPSWSIRAVVGAARVDQADPARALLRHRAAATLAASPSCIRHVCVGAGGSARPGDTITVTVAGGDYHANQSVASVCEYVPAVPDVRCERQEPEQWVVKEVPPPPPDGGTSP